MCLTTLTRAYVAPQKYRSGTGYKVFTKRGERLFYKYQDGSRPVKRGIWLKAKAPLLPAHDSPGFYRGGFHLCETEADMKTFQNNPWEYGTDSVVLPVRWKGLLAEGTQRDAKCLVAMWIKIPPGPLEKRRRKRSKKS